jgi:protein SCO1/2
MSENFGALESAVVADPRLAARTRLLSISFDPERDTAEILKSYGLRFHDPKSGPPFAIWTLASGSGSETKKLIDFFGVWVQKDGDGFSHGLVTSVVDGDGRVVRSFFGNSWKPEDVLAELRRLTTRG